MKRRKSSLGRSNGCTEVVFRRAHKGGPILPSSKWKVVTRCAGKTTPKPSASRRRSTRPVCRRRGQYWRERMNAQIRAGRPPTAQLFTSCK